MEQKRWIPRASAELTLIVVGVLTALALESWFGGLRDRRSEAEYIADLRNELALNQDNLTAITRINEGSQRSLLHLASLLERGLAADSAETFVVGLSRDGTRLITPLVASAVFQDLRDSGRLQLIRDPDLRRGIMETYSYLEFEARGPLEKGRDRIGSGLMALLARRIPAGLVIREGIQVSDPTSWKLGPAATPADVRAAAQALAADPLLLGEIRAEMESLERERFAYGRLQDQLDAQAGLLAGFAAADTP